MTDYVYPTPLGVRKVDVEKFATEVAEKLGFRPGDDMIGLVNRLGGKLVTGSTGSEDSESGSMIARSLSDFTIYISPFTSLERDRFTIAHELGHLLLHLPKIKKTNGFATMRATRHVDEGDPGQRRAEWEANWFAAAFLMPAREFRIAYLQGPSCAQSKFKVSLAAVDSRASSLNIR